MITVFRNVTVGGLSKEELIERLEKADIQFNKYALTLFAHPDLNPSEISSVLKLTKVRFADLNLKGPCSIQSILTNAFNLGPRPCPIYLAAFLRLEYLDQPEGPYLTIASTPPENEDADYPTGFYLRNSESQLWLRGYKVDGEPDWPADNEFIFTM